MRFLTYVLYHSDQRTIHGGSGNIYVFDVLVLFVLIGVLVYLFWKGAPPPPPYGSFD